MGQHFRSNIKFGQNSVLKIFMTKTEFADFLFNRRSNHLTED